MRSLLDDATTVGLTPDRWDLVLVFMGLVVFGLGVLVAVKL